MHSSKITLLQEIKENLLLSVPLIASQVIYSCSGFIGTALVARLGEDALAASVLVFMLWLSLSVLFFGLLNSISVLVAHQYGARDREKISEIMGQSFLLGVLLAVILILILFCMPLFLNFTSQSPHVLSLARAYMHSLILTIPGLLALVIIEQFLAGINRARFVLWISLIVVPIEIPIIYILIFGKFGFPAFGIAGIGYGFAITYTMTAITVILYLLRSNYYRQYKIFKGINSINLKWIKELISVGLPIGFMHVIEISTLTVMTFWIAQFGTTILAAHQIAIQYLGFFITIVFAMSQAVTVRVGHAVGQNCRENIYQSLYVGTLLSGICMFIIAIAFYYFPEFFIRIDIDINDPKNLKLIEDASILLMICGLQMFIENFRMNGFGALRGIKDTTFSMYTSLLSFWGIGLSLAYFLGFHWNYKAPGIWWGVTLGIGIGLIIIWLRFFIKIRTIDLKEVLEI